MDAVCAPSSGLMLETMVGPLTMVLCRALIAAVLLAVLVPECRCADPSEPVCSFDGRTGTDVALALCKVFTVHEPMQF